MFCMEKNPITIQKIEMVETLRFLKPWVKLLQLKRKQLDLIAVIIYYFIFLKIKKVVHKLELPFGGGEVNDFLWS